MGSMQDRIMAEAVRMGGEFTTADMAMAIWGSIKRNRMSHVFIILAKLARWGDIERVGRKNVDGSLMMVWRVV